MSDSNVTLRAMTEDDYTEVRKLWESIHGFAIRSIDDSRENIERFLKRNEGISVVAVQGGEPDVPASAGAALHQPQSDNERIVGAILCGHDGRTATFYHVCVDEQHRRQGIGKKMVVFCMNALMKEQINTISLVAFTNNDIGNQFWHSIGWEKRSDVNQYRFKLNKNNVIAFTK